MPDLFKRDKSMDSNNTSIAIHYKLELTGP